MVKKPHCPRCRKPMETPSRDNINYYCPFHGTISHTQMIMLDVTTSYNNNHDSTNDNYNYSSVNNNNNNSSSYSASGN